MPMDGREQPYGMPTSMMASLHNSASTFVGPTVTMYSLLQGSGSTVNNLVRTTLPLGTRFSAQPMPTFTTSFTEVLRQQMGENNHEMVHIPT